MKRFYRRLFRKKATVVACVILVIFIAMAFIGPFFTAQDPYTQNLGNKYLNISSNHWLGTDELGRDTFTRLVFGARISLGIAFVGVFFGTIAGVFLGVCAGYYGGKVDILISRMIDILLAFPGILIAILIVAILGVGTVNTTIAVAIFIIPSMTRIVRGSVLAISHEEFVTASKAFGTSSMMIIIRHIIPNILPIIIVNVTIDLGSAILTASSLSFLGLGVQAPHPEWGAILSQMRQVMRTYPLGVLAPGLMITAVVLSFSLLGDGLRDALDPKS